MMPLAGYRILIVEDELPVAMLIEDMLTAAGCEHTASAAHPDRALAAIREFNPDAAILDVNLGGCDSYSVAAELAARCVPFIFATGYGRVREEYGFVPVLQKPFTTEELDRVLTSLLEGGRADPAGA